MTDHAGELGLSPTRGLNIEYDREWLSRHQLVESDLREYRALQSAQARLTAIGFLATAFHPGPRVEADLETQALDLLMPLVRMKIPEPNAPRWLRKAEDFLHAGFRDSISLRNVALEVRVHPVYLARVFRRIHRCNMSEYLRTLRLTEASRLVMQGAPLAQAAYAAGFADQAHFSRCCATALGFGPKGLWPARQAFRK